MDVLQRLGATAAIAAAALLGIPPAFAQFAQVEQYAAREPAGPYVGLGAGAQWLDSLSASGPAGREFKLNYDAGPVGLGSLGYAFGNGFRAEVEIGFRHSDAKSITIPSGATLPSSLDVKANAQATTYMVNGFYDFRLAPTWSAYLGAGVGAAMVRVNNVGHDSPLAFQAMTGVEYALTPQMRLGLGYKFLGTDSLKLRQNSDVISSHPNYYDHAVLVTFRYNFGVPAAVRPAAAVSPPPPAPPPAAGTTAPPPFSREFTVYFATNSAVLNPAGREVVREAATAAKDNAPTRINVGGYADTTGPAGYNQQLSNRRAQAVRKELIANGVAPDDIATAAYGESDLAVPTADNVKEPRNRRVLISIKAPGV